MRTFFCNPSILILFGLHARWVHPKYTWSRNDVGAVGHKGVWETFDSTDVSCATQASDTTRKWSRGATGWSECRYCPCCCVLHKYQVEGDNSVSAPNSVPKPSRGTTPTVDSKVRLLRKNHGNMEDLGGDKRDRRGGQKKYRVVQINTEPSNVAVWKRQYKQIGRNVTRSTLLWHSEILAATESCETQPNRGTISQ